MLSKNQLTQIELKKLAALIYYKFDVPTLIRYLGGNYTGELGDVEYTISMFRKSKCDEKLIKKSKIS